jgi:hypothetical protein
MKVPAYGYERSITVEIKPKLKVRLKAWWKWRRADKRYYPYRYTGPTVKFALDKKPMSYGLPLQKVPGQKGTFKGDRFLDPNGIIRIIPTNHTGKR